ncbi:hypothetical protein [Agrobacterium tumefaciens]|uniref:hypothetical protein n=1 Tax=Agrobacterium tumefaciens TaxID=358 RepID=UPI000975946F|nr:hypothetical protein BV900_17040 [Agrobacterium tumefaciens]
MKKFLKSLVVTAAVILAGAAAAQAGTINLKIKNNSAKTIYVDAVPVCTGCTWSSVPSISSGGTGTLYATSNAGTTSMTYSVDYSNYFGTSFTEKGCRATITVEVTGSLITNVISRSWSAYTGNPSCGSSTPVLSGGDVVWDVRFNAS